MKINVILLFIIVSGLIILYDNRDIFTLNKLIKKINSLAFDKGSYFGNPFADSVYWKEIDYDFYKFIFHNHFKNFFYDLYAHQSMLATKNTPNDIIIASFFRFLNEFADEDKIVSDYIVNSSDLEFDLMEKRFSPEIIRKYYIQFYQLYIAVGDIAIQKKLAVFLLSNIIDAGNNNIEKIKTSDDKYLLRHTNLISYE